MAFINLFCASSSARRRGVSRPPTLCVSIIKASVNKNVNAIIK